MTVPLPSLTARPGPIAAALDALSHDERVNWMRGLSRRELRALFALAGQSDPLDLSFFHGEPGVIVRHHGQNSLPVFNAFEKRLVLRDGVVQGYNHTARLTTWFAGPGHFIATQDDDGVLFDYRTLPETTPGDFPPLKPNDQGTATLVYGHMTDRMRRVSAHCTIGAAFKNGKAMNSWFMLVREEPA
ncbi:MAG: hypothetical protein AAFV53_02525 [Myxococcota bacterium]